MDQAEPVLDDIRSVEDPHALRLMAVLSEMVRRRGKKGAARELGIDHRTVGVSIDEGKLTRRVREALERALVEKADADVADQGRRIGALEERFDALSERVNAGLEEIAAGSAKRDGELREEFARGLGGVGRRLSALEEARATPAAGTKVNGPRPSPVHSADREHPELVTRMPAPDDAEVLGPAWPLVAEWRALKDTRVDDGKGIVWLAGEVRLLEIEVALVTEFGMTLPPETEPLRGFGRAGQLNWRLAALSDAQRSLSRRRLARRILTLGLWRG